MRRAPRGLPASVSELPRCAVMGIVNATPDSFSDGGRFFDSRASIGRARELLREGADLIDVGGESTRPGANRVEAQVELDRILPIIRTLADDGACVSVDTMRAEVALAAVENGAGMVNDVSGGRADPDMAATLASLRTRGGSPPVYIAMHWRGHSADMESRNVYDDVVADVIAELGASLECVLAAGVDAEYLALDPGLGFAKDAEADWALLRALPQIVELGYPVLVGASRKRFLAGPSGAGADPDSRDEATAAVTALAARAGAWAVRVHAARASVIAARVASAWDDECARRTKHEEDRA